MFKRIVLFIMMIPVRIITIPIILVLWLASSVVGLINSVGNLATGILNMVLLFAAFGIILNKEWHLFFNIGLFIFLEVIILAIGSVVQSILEVIREKIVSVIF